VAGTCLVSTYLLLGPITPDLDHCSTTTDTFGLFVSALSIRCRVTVMLSIVEARPHLLAAIYNRPHRYGRLDESRTSSAHSSFNGWESGYDRELDEKDTASLI
jgi:hypothetical protein